MPMYIGGSRPEWLYLKNKSILLRCPAGTAFCPAKADCRVTVQISFDEPTLGLKHVPVAPLLRLFAEAATTVVRAFDAH
jgi:hypothetical protein